MEYSKSLIASLGLSLFVLAGPGTAADYQRVIRPLLATKCAACHGALRQEAGLRLDAGSLILRGSENGPIVTPGQAEASPLVARIRSPDPHERMPPEGEGEPLDDQQIGLIVAWINDGAPYPADESIPLDPTEHWAYQSLVRPPVPEVHDARWSHPIDAFIAHRHKRQGLSPVGLGDRRTLLRRLYLDLVGLPPTRAQQDRFEANDASQSWRHEVDALLDSPHYGERWGRHWMDVWRYSDWAGYQQELRTSQRHIWRWRDWIVDSLNADKGYDRMVLEMLAGDELAGDELAGDEPAGGEWVDQEPPDTDPAAVAATGFLARNYRSNNRDMWLDATVEHTAKAFLGLTINCARCHDHKYDPIAQTAYYQFRAIFEPHQVRTDPLPGEPDTNRDGLPRAYDADLSAQTYLYRGGDEKRPDKDHPLDPRTPAILGGALLISPVALTVDAYYPALGGHVSQSQVAAAQGQLAAAKSALAEATAPSTADKAKTDAAAQPTDVRLLELRVTAASLGLQSLVARQAAERQRYGVGTTDTQGSPADLAPRAAAAERRLHAHEALIVVREKELALRAAQTGDQQDAGKKKQAVMQAQQALDEAWQQLAAAQQALTKTDADYTPLGEVYPRTSSGRRLALARWIVAQNNPLAARVAVNHLWLRHFGTPLVDNVFDFGLRSPRPRHAELLDWLAVELMENHWSMKHLHRLILTSRTWRLASTAGPEASGNTQIDPDNRSYWRGNVRRLEAEVVRDQVLAVSEQLDSTLGGADIDYQQGEVSRRRSVYLRHAYEKQMAMLVQFDAASPNECYRRSESIVPQQALALTNSSLTLDKSRLLAKRLWEEVEAEARSQAAFVSQAYRRILARPPAEEEASLCLEFLSSQAGVLSATENLTALGGGPPATVKPSPDPQQRARENLVHVLMNHNDFVTVR